ncbi:MAG: hypothetical protein GKR89_19160 [Candidatus Latescibacteria bacterium]|nr:hypothetical protein [Candidatus Latescibacterota bacterium]
MQGANRYRSSWILLCALLLAAAGRAWSAQVVALEKAPVIDGVLVEWGRPEALALRPGGDKVGVRGGFNGLEDHEVDIYLMWDAEHMYVAAVVEDDTLDATQLAPGDHVWERGGQRKDEMFYYDHCKIFLRAEGAPLGYNIWMGPGNDQEQPYRWGHQQWGEESAAVPVRLASVRRGRIYTYEVAIPWSWLSVRPQPGMSFDAVFLVTDSDNPGLAMRKKIARGEKTVWWQGKIHLAGEPPNLPPPPVDLEEEIAAGVEQRRAQPLPKLPPAGSKKPEKVAVVEEAAEAPANPVQEKDPAPPTDAPAEVAAAPSAPVVAVPSVASLNRHLLARRQVVALPGWVDDLNEDGDLTDTQVDTLVRQMAHHVHRLSAGHINGRTDAVIVTMADSNRVPRSYVRALAVNLLGRIDQEADADTELRAGIDEQARRYNIEEEQARRLVRDLCQRAAKLYAEHKISTTNELLKQSGKKAKLSSKEARQLVIGMLEEWAQ